MVAIALVVAWRLGYFDITSREGLADLLRRGRATLWAAPLYLVVYILAATVGLPTTPLSIVGGALFGAVRGMALAWIAEMVATLTAYTLARSIGQRPVRRFLGRHHLLARIKKQSGFSALVRLRVLPVAPFAVLDYVAGLAGVPIRTLLLATAVGILPSVVGYTYAGAELAIGLEQTGVARLRALWIAAALTVVMVTISLVPAVMRRIRR